MIPRWRNRRWFYGINGVVSTNSGFDNVVVVATSAGTEMVVVVVGSAVDKRPRPRLFWCVPLGITKAVPRGGSFLLLLLLLLLLADYAFATIILVLCWWLLGTTMGVAVVVLVLKTMFVQLGYALTRLLLLTALSLGL